MQNIYYCGTDRERLKLTKGRYSLFFRCPCCGCMNRISRKEEEELESMDLKPGRGYRVGALNVFVEPINNRYQRVFVSRRA